MDQLLWSISAPQMKEYPVSEDLPKQELLIKLLKMTTSSNDGEAVVAVRKANELLRSAGWDWERLIQGKIKVIEDPFKSVGTPQNINVTRGAPPAPPRPAPQPKPAYTAGGTQTGRFGGGGGGGGSANSPFPPQQPRAPRQPPKPYSSKDNMYSGWCWCCGDPVDAKAGWIFDPTVYNKNARPRTQWHIVCNDCNKNNAFVPPAAALRKRQMVGGAAPSLGDI